MIVDARTRFLYRASLVAFAATLAYTFLLSRVLPNELASPLGTLRTPIIAFELARSRLDLLAVFGAGDDPGRNARIAAMLHGHELDAGYLVVYNLFLGLFVGAVAHERSSPRLLFAIALPLCAAAADAWENVVLVALLAKLDHPESLLQTLAVATWCKWGALAIATAAAGVGVYALRRRVIGALGLLPLLTALMAYADPHRFGELLSVGLAVAWIALAFHAASRARASGSGTGGSSTGGTGVTSTGGTGASGAGGSGGSATGGSGGSATGGAAGAATGGTGGTGIGGAAGATGANCSTSAEQQCGSLLSTCQSDTACTCVFDCIQGGGAEGTCKQDCSLPQGNEPWANLVDCLDTSCQNSC